MEFTGERYVPGIAGLEEIYIEHLSRYVFAGRIAGAKSVLDVGCGCGYGAHHIARVGAHTVVGVDVSIEAIQFAKANYPASNLHFAVMDAYELALGQPFELVTCFEVIEHVEHPGGVLEQIARAVSDHGVLLVSTPNKETYVAGGKAGSNPFHWREYSEGEFRDLLTSYFRCVTIFGQHWSDSIIIKPTVACEVLTGAEAMPLPPANSCRGHDIAIAEPAYFVAACSQDAWPDAGGTPISTMVIHSFDERYLKLKEIAARLEAELDKRARWARGLESEVHKRDSTIRSLQHELKSLRKEFDERGEWAQGLDRKIGEQAHLIQGLKSENAKLKRIAGVRV